jgi:hypothetical protein
MRSAYVMIGIALAGVTGIGANFALKARGPRAAWAFCAVVAVLVSLIGLLDWRLQVVKETPLHTYMAIALVPAVAAAAATHMLSKTGLPFSVRVAATAVLWIGLAYLALYSAFYP